MVLDAPVAVYNLEVAGAHTYFVEDGLDRQTPLWVHNNCNPKAIEWHHLLPKEFKKRFQKAGLDIEDFKILLEAGRHRLRQFGGIHTGPNNWNAQWRKYFASVRIADRSEILAQLAKMRREFGI